MSKHWYIVHTYSGYEEHAKLALKEKIRLHDMEDKFGEILIPSEKIVELVKGKKKLSTRKFYPGYMFVNMEMDNETWHVVKDTPKVTGFVGRGKAPKPVPEEEINEIFSQMDEGVLKPKPKVMFEKGDSIKVVDGPFTNFNGVVAEVKPDKGKVRVLVSIFGRTTPVELEFFQIQRN
ncbi:MAG: transcription termination/antitermination protein NusG [Thermodesulfobacteriota bacterium]|nr:transcription termination/antitermination protein NusG [Thermodesulfobacteriota bacterium]